MTNIKTNDNRTNTYPTFKDIREGAMFTETNCSIIYIKTAVLKSEDDTTTNVIDLEGDTHWFDGDEEIQLIREIKITIKK